MISRILSRIWVQLRRGSALGSRVMESSIMRGALRGEISLALLTEQRAVLRDNDRLVADEVNDQLKGAGALRDAPPLGMGGGEVEYRMHRADFACRVAHGSHRIRARTVVALGPATHETALLVEEPLHAHLA